MNAKLKAKWLKALRSNSYKQGQSCLVSSDGMEFCCLGVLADIQGCVWEEDGHGALHPKMPHGRGTFGSSLTGEKSNTYLKRSRAGGLSLSEQKRLAEMNDNGDTFRKIATYIEANL